LFPSILRPAKALVKTTLLDVLQKRKTEGGVLPYTR